MKKLFGTDGIRGVANHELTPELTLAVGQAHGVLLQRSGGGHPTVVLGRDTRISGPMLESAYLAGLCSTGADVLQVGVLPTPAVAWLVMELGADGGVMISASHNPIADNGLKLFTSSGTKIPDEWEIDIERMIVKPGPSIRPTGSAVGQARLIGDAADRYVQHLKLSLNTRFDGQSVVLDCAHGAAFAVGPRLFAELGATVTVLNAAPDGTNINVECGCTHLSVLREAIQSTHGGIVGFAFDGDADRCLAVNEEGTAVDGDQIMLALADDLHRQGQLQQDTVVATVMSNLGFEKALQRKGLRLVRAAVGDRFVLEQMQAIGAILGGEQSGHIIQLRHAPTGDGVFTAARLLQLMQQQGKPLSAITGGMEHFPQLLVNVRAHNKAGLVDDGEITLAISQIQAQLQDRGRLLVRPSGTEPLVRVMAEGPDAAELQEVVHRLAALIEQRLG